MPSGAPGGGREGGEDAEEEERSRSGTGGTREGEAADPGNPDRESAARLERDAMDEDEDEDEDEVEVEVEAGAQGGQEGGRARLRRFGRRRVGLDDGDAAHVAVQEEYSGRIIIIIIIRSSSSINISSSIHIKQPA
ncbi:hypothetical protein VTN02DRAFT_1214 [Thermoascus thermophilus]